MKTTAKIGGVMILGVVLALGLCLTFVFLQTDRLLVGQIQAQALLLIKTFEAQMDRGFGQEQDGRNPVYQQALTQLARELPNLTEVNLYQVSDTPSVVASTDEAQVGKEADPEDVEAAQTDQAVVLFGTEDGREFIDVTAPLHTGDRIGYVIGIKLSVQEAWDELGLLLLQTAGLGALGVGLMAVVVALVLRRMRRTLGAEPEDLVGVVETLAAGRPVVNPAGATGVRRSLGTMAEALEVLSAEIAEIAAGDFRVEIRPRSEDDRLALSLQRLVGQLGTTVGQVQDAMALTLASAGQVRQASESLSQATSQQASSLEEVSASITDLGQRSRAAADQAGQSKSQADQTLEAVRAGGRKVAELVAAMAAIEEANQRILGVVETIDDIAFQTNLLSLNANVEASRAGSSGRGFAVVAGEVRSLSQRSAQAVKETSTLVATCLATVQSGGKLVREVESTLAGIGSQSESVARLAAGLAEDGRGQASALRDLEGALGQIDRSTQANAATAEQTASSSQVLTDQARKVQELLDQFRWNDGV